LVILLSGGVPFDTRMRAAHQCSAAIHDGDDPVEPTGEEEDLSWHYSCGA
jgi:hypothetical protein